MNFNYWTEVQQANTGYVNGLITKEEYKEIIKLTLS